MIENRVPALLQSSKNSGWYKANVGSSPVIDADMKAVISLNGDNETLQLRDDGVAPDNIKNDGIYSR